MCMNVKPIRGNVHLHRGLGPVKPVIVKGEAMPILRIVATLVFAVAAAMAADTPATSLRITELHYHPLNPTAEEIARGGSSASDDKYEFIEFTNLSAAPLDVSGCAIADAVTYAFPAGSIIPARGKVVVVNDPASFRARYGAEIPVFGAFTKGNISNSSEPVTLTDAGGTTIQGFTYLDIWYPGTDGVSQQPDGGYSLKLLPAAYISGPWDVAASWAPSAAVHGSPGYDDGEVSGKPHFSRPPGPFTGSFQLVITADAPDSVIRYTLDGSLPTATSTIYTAPITISTTGQVRAVVKGVRSPSGPVTSAYYLKLTPAAAGFATHLPVVLVDTFGMAVPVTSSTDQVMGVVTILPETPAGTADAIGARVPSLVVRTGISEHGSSSASFTKQSLAVEAWDENNQDASFAPLGLPAGEDWALVGPYYYDSAFIRNAVAYEMSNRIGRYAPHLRLVEVFARHVAGDIDAADYQGIFILAERVKRGSNRVDVEKLTPADITVPAVQGGYIIKVDNPSPGEASLTIAAGTPQQQRIVMVYPDADTLVPAQSAWLKNYLEEFAAAIQAPNFTNPTTGKHYAEYIDVDAWIDHHIIELLFKNIDALRKSAYMHKTREGRLVAGPIWDLDRCADSKDPRDDDPYTISGPPDATVMFEYPWWNRLFADPDFMQRYIDRLQVLLATKFTAAELHGAIDQYADQLNAFFPPEVRSPAARDATKWTQDAPRSYTQVDVTYTGYIAEVIRMKAWLQNRVEFLKGYWPAPPTLSRASGTVEQGYALSINAAVGTIHYTLDGSDPRASGGTPAAGAQAYAGPIVIDGPVTVTARVRDGERWSSPVSGRFIIASAIPLRITEVMYNPAADNDPATDDQAYEYIELKNVSLTEAVDLTGLKVAGGVDYTFSGGTLAPRALVLLVVNRAAFESRYGTGRPVAGVYTGQLSNGGERLRLLGTDDSEIQAFTYSDAWHPTTDGTGPSLVINDPFGPKAQWEAAAGWRPSYDVIDGTPGEDENRGPSATGEEYATDVNQALAMTVVALTANDVDPDTFDELSIKRVPNPAALGSAFATTKGTLSLALNAVAGRSATITYMPPTNFYGTDYFSYQAIDLYGVASIVVSVKITVKTPLVRINEFWTHTDSPNADGLEVLNPTAFPVDIGGWRVAKNPGGAGSTYSFPAGTIIQPNQILVVDCDATDGNGVVTIPGDWGTTFSPKSGAIYLLPRVDGTLRAPISGTTFPVSLDGQSFGHYLTSDGRIVFPLERRKTIGSPNAGPRVGPIVITEIMYAPQPGEHQFIELQNIGSTNVRLDRSMGVLGETKTFGWRIDGITFSFPPGFILSPGQMCVVVDGAIPIDQYRQQRNIPTSVPMFNFSGTMRLTGTRIALQQAENFDSEPTLYWLTNDLVDFKNGGVWPSVAGGSGRSIVRKTKNAYGDEPVNWTLSLDVGGSPGTADGASPPNAAEDSYAMNPGVALLISAPGVLANDNDPNRDPLTAVLRTAPANGTLILNANGSFQYRPRAGFSGIDRFTYQAVDATGLSSPIATVAVNVGVNQYEARVQNATDDAEEHEDGVMDLSSTDLELTWDAKVDGAQPRGHQWIGIRYGGLPIPRGAHITSAYLQFTSTSEVPASDACQLTFWAQAADNADTFHDSIAHEISLRPRTTTSVAWAPSPWLVNGEAGALQRTPNLAAILQPVVERSGWTPGSAIAILINGTGKRVAEALDGSHPESCARFHVEWDLGGPYGNPDAYSVTQGQTLTVPAAGGVLVNDGTLGSRPALSAILVATTANGTLTLGGNGAFTYTPLANLSGQDRFTYKVSDGLRESPPVTVTLDVLAPSIDYAAGLDYEYWWCRLSSVNEITGLGAAIRNGAVASFDLAPRDQDDNFAFRYRGFITLPAAGDYTFSLRSDEGSALWLDGTLVVDNDGIHSNSLEKSGLVSIATPGRHAIELRYFERDGAQSLVASYAGPGIVKQTIPASVLSRATRERLKGVDDRYSVATNGTLTVGAANGVLKNDLSLLGAPLSAVLVSGPALGTFTTAFAPNGTFTYKPNVGAKGYDTFTYRCTDGSNRSALVAVTITVGSPDAARPVANPDTYITNAGKVLAVSIAEGVLRNDTDPNGDALRAFIVTAPNPAQGSLAGNKIEIDGRFIFTPAAGFIGTATFTYKCNDGTFDSEPKTVTIEVLPPTPLDEYTLQRTGGFPHVGKDMSGIAWNPDTQTYFVIANDTSTLGDGRKVQIFEYLPDLATLVRGIRVVQADAPAPFEDKAAYDAEDIVYLGNNEFAIGLECHREGSQTIPNRVAIVRIDAGTLEVNTNLGQCISIILPPSAFDNNGLEGLGYDRNGNGGLGAFYATQEKNPITVWRFNRPADRTTIRTYQAATECGLTIPFNATTLLEGRFIIGDLSGVLFDHRTGRLLLVSDEGQALVDVDISGRVIGQFSLPSSLEGGADQYEGLTLGKDYKLVAVSEPNTFTELVNVSLPIADADTYSMADNTTLTIAASAGVLANDSDGNNQPLTAMLATGPAVGALSLAANGGFTYTPPTGFTGTASFTYRASDGWYQSAPAQVTINVSSFDRPPVAQPDGFTLAEDALYTAPASILINDSDPDGDPRFAVVDTRPLHGTLSMRADGIFTYRPVANYHGTDSFTYRCRAGSAESAPVAVALTITPVNDAPVAVPEAQYTIAEDGTLTIAAPGLLANDYDVDGDPISAELVAAPAHGTVTIAADGAFTYRPAADFRGSDSFRYRCRDAATASLEVTVPITVNAVNDAPVAAAESHTVAEDGTLTVPAPGLLANDRDADGDTLTIGRIATQPAHGTLTWTSDGQFTYRPAADWNGTDRFTYTAFDSLAHSTPATVTITVTPVEDAPRPIADSYWTRVGRTLTVTAALGVLANDIEPDGQAMTAVVGTGPAHGTLALAADGSFTYVPAVGYIGNDTFSYTVRSGSLSAAGLVSLQVKPLDIAPTVGAIVVAAAPVIGSSVGLSVSASDPDGGPAPMTYTWRATGPAVVAFDGNGQAGAARTVAHFSAPGAYQINVEVGDGELSSTSAAVSVTVVQSGGVSLNATDATAAEGIASDTGSFTLSRSSAAVGSPLAVTIVWSGGASAGTDYQALPTVVTIPAGATSTMVTVTPADDALVEGAETVVGTIVSSPLFVISKASDTLTILDDEKPRVSPRLVDGAGGESGSDGIVLRLNRYPVKAGGATLNVTPGFSGTATLNVDYRLPASSFTFSGTTGDIDIPVTRLDDALAEGTETIVMSVPGAADYEAGAPASARLGDDERPEVSMQVNDGTAAEPTDTGLITVTRWPAGAQALTVAYAVSGNLALIQPLPGSVQIPANAASATIAIATGDDSLMEVAGRVTVSLTAGAYQLTGTTQGAITILADTDYRAADPVSTDRLGLDYAFYTSPTTWNTLPDFSRLTPVRTGGVALPTLDPATQRDLIAFVYTGYLDIPADGEWRLSVASDDGSQLWIGDQLVVDNNGLHSMREYTSPILRLRAGKHAMRLTFFENLGYEALTMSWQGPGIAKQPIPATRFFRSPLAPNLPPAIGAISPAGQTVVGTSAALTVTASDPDHGPAPLTYTWQATGPGPVTFDGNGTAAAASTVAHWTAMGTYQISVVVGDGEAMATASTTLVAVQSTGLSLSRSDSSAAENVATDTATFILSRAAATAAADLPVSIAWSDTATAGVDYQALPAVVTIPAGAASTVITVRGIDDELIEGSETVVGTITPSPLYLISKASDSVTIYDDEKPLVRAVGADNVGVETGSDGMVLRLNRYPVKSGATVTVTPTFTGTATLGIDYQLPASSFTFTGTAANIDIRVTLLDDALVEGTESIIMSTPVSTAYEAGTPFTAWLIDDEKPEVRLQVTDGTAAEPADTGIITVSRRPVSASPMDVAYTVSGNLDLIQPLPGVVRIPANAASATITIATGDDSRMEVAGRVTVSLVAAPAYQLAGTTQGAVSILADSDYREADTVSGTRPGLDYAFYTTPARWPVLPDFDLLTPLKTGMVALPDLSPRTQEVNFGFVFTGYLSIPVDGQWYLSTASDDGTKLWLGDQLVVSNDGNHGIIEITSSLLRLKAGRHRMRLEFCQGNGPFGLNVSWQGPGIAKQAIPAAAFFRPVQAPTGIADTYRATAGQLLTVPAATGVLSNDSDPEGHALTAALIAGPAAGTLVLAVNGGFTFQAPGFDGPVTFTYRASDGVAGSAPVTVTIDVQPPTALAQVHWR